MGDNLPDSASFGRIPPAQDRSNKKGRTGVKCHVGPGARTMEDRPHTVATTAGGTYNEVRNLKQ